MAGLLERPALVNVADYGYTILSDPPDAKLDIVFVHGLQGHPEKTWTYNVKPAQDGQRHRPDSLAPPTTVSKRRHITDLFRPRSRSPKATSSDQGTGNPGPPDCNTSHNVYWPRDLLAADFPDARVMTFGYDTNVVKAGRPVHQGNILSHTRNLLYDLVDKRKGKAIDRDLVFIAHSLGGILVKAALQRSEFEKDRAIQKIYKSTTGIMFFGTPHRGSENWASKATKLALLASHLLQLDVNDQNLRALLPDGTEFEHCRESFAQQWNERRHIWTVRTFQESSAVVGFRGLNELIVPAESSTLDHPDQRARMLDANHISMVKFSGRDDRGYQAVNVDIQELMDKAGIKRVPSFDDFTTQDTYNCLRAFRTSQYEQAKDRNPQRLDHTCLWFLDHEQYSEWRKKDGPSMLWVTANPGCGKSVLAKHLVEQELTESPNGANIVAYFFFKEDSEEQASASNAISALLHQIFSAREELIHHAMKTYKKEGDKIATNFQKLWTILVEVASSFKTGKIICVLDGLDECTEQGRNHIIDALCAFYKKAAVEGHDSCLKFLVTSRPYHHIQRRFDDLTRNVSSIRLHGENETIAISQEIRLYIACEIDRLSYELNLGPEERRIVEDGIGSMTHPTYLWARLVFDILHKTARPSRKNLRSIINELPRTVDEAYEAILSRVDERDVSQARKLLSIVVTAARPLTVQELNVALAIEVDHTSWIDIEEELPAEASFESSVRDLCGLFVTIINRRIYLIHQTARRFLLSQGKAATGWKSSLHPVNAELVLATSCIVIITVGATNALATDFFKYAGYYWAAHYRKTEKQASKELQHLAVAICDPKKQTNIEWLAIFQRIDEIPAMNDALSLASYLGLASVVEQLLVTGNGDVDVHVNDGRTPLAWAANGGYTEVATLLLDTGKADIEAIDSHGWTPLQIACRSRREDTTLHLLSKGADPGYRNTKRTSALSDAASMGLLQVVQQILDHTAQSNLEELLSRYNDEGSSVLHLAARSEYDKRFNIFQAVIESSKVLSPSHRHALLYHEDTARCNVMFRAAQMNRPKIIQLLATTERPLLFTRGWFDWNDTPLHVATHWQNAAAVEALVAAGSDVTLRQRSGQTPLLIASHRPDSPDGVNIFETLLLQPNTDPLAAGNEGETILHLILRHNRPLYLETIRSRLPLPRFRHLLITKDANGNIPLFEATKKFALADQDYAGRSNSYKAACEALYDCISEMDANALLHLLDENDQKNAVHAYIEVGHEDLVVEALHKLILHDRSLLDVRDHRGQTPLMKAVDRQQRRVTRSIIQATASLDEQDTITDKTALHFAVARDDPETTALLLEAGAQLNIPDRSGRTPMESCSTHNRCYEILASKANINSVPSSSEASLKASRASWSVTFGAQPGSCHWNHVGNWDWYRSQRTEHVHEARYLSSEAIPTTAKLPILKVKVMVEGRDQGWSSDEWFSHIPVGEFASDARYEIAILRDTQLVLRREWARCPHRSKEPHKFECVWYSDSQLNQERNFGGRRPASDDDQGDFVRKLTVGDQIVVLALASGEGWMNITKSASIEIFFET